MILRMTADSLDAYWRRIAERLARRGVRPGTIAYWRTRGGLLTSAEIEPLVGRSGTTLKRWRARGNGPPCYQPDPAAPARYQVEPLLDWLDATERHNGH
jgi:hypothetical protein